MKEESLDQARKILIEAILQSNIKEEDKLELAINVMHFLDHYRENIKTLQREKRR